MLIDLTHEAIAPSDDLARHLFNDKVNDENVQQLRKNPYVVLENLVLDNVDLAITELEATKPFGVNLLVDLTSIGIKRDIRALRQISDASNVQVVAGCGLFVQDSLPEMYLSWSEDKIFDLMMSDITKGIDGTDMKAGVIGEIGVSEYIHPIEEKSLRAAARAANESGLPVMVHTYPWSESALQAVQLLLSESVPPEKICVCHMDVTFNKRLMTMLLSLGVYIEFDNFGKEFDFPPQEGAFAGGPFETDQKRVQMLSSLCKMGYTKQLLLANDVCIKSLLRKHGGSGYVHLFERIVPMMRDTGFDNEAVHTLIHENPIRFLFS